MFVSSSVRCFPVGLFPGVRGAARRCACRLGLLLLAAALVPACASNDRNLKAQSQSAFKLGTAYLREGRTTLALQEFARAESLTPDDPEVLHSLGLTYWVRKEHTLAAEKFRHATAVKPGYSEAWNSLGALFLDQGRYAEAIPAFESALKNLFYDTRELSLSNLGWALYKTGRNEEAEKRLREAVEFVPMFWLARKNLGIVLQERSEYREALLHLTEAGQLAPDDAETHLRLGLSLFKTGDREGARAAFDKAWHLAPAAEAGKSAKTYLDLLQ